MAKAIKLRSGDITTDIRIDRINEKDPRSWEYSIRELLPTKIYNKPRSYTWKAGPTLRQKGEGACVGFAWTHELAARPLEITGLEPNFALKGIYYEAQRNKDSVLI
jgi:hypothetical protein